MANTTTTGILVGNMMRVAASFLDAQKLLNDPDVVKFKIELPDKSIVDYTYGVDAELVKVTIGKYYVDISLDNPGTYEYYFYSTGTGQAAAQGSFIVIDKEIQP